MNRSIKASATVFIALLFLLALATPGSAATGLFVVNGDFNASTASTNTYVGSGVATDPGNTFWNPLVVTDNSAQTFTSGTLKATTSNGTTDDTGITISVSVPATKKVGVLKTAGAPNFAVALLQDYLHNLSTELETLTFSNVPAGSYNLYLYSVNSFHDSATTQFDITTGGTGTATATNSAAGANSFVLNDNYVLFTGLSPVGGAIAATALDVGGNSTAINGFQLVQTPEPASLGLMILGGAMLVQRRRPRA